MDQKRRNFARNERLHPDWPFKVPKYDCWLNGEPPQELWDTAHEMRRLWNKFVLILQYILTLDIKDDAGKPLLSKEMRRVLWGRLNTKYLREIGKQHKELLDSGCREAVVVRFMTAVGNWRTNPMLYGLPKYQYGDGMNSISIPLVYNDGKSVDWLTNEGGTSSVHSTLHIKKNAPKDEKGNPVLTEEQWAEYLNNGHFCVGINRVPINLHIAYGGRSGQRKYYLPSDCRIKQVALCGRRDSALGWSWSFQVKLEHPPETRQPTGRVCGWDVGWRLMDGYIRLGVIVDNAGNFYEMMLPLAIGELSKRRRREIKHCQKKGWDYSKPISFDDLAALDARYGVALDSCKAQIRKIFEEEKDRWPDEAKQAMIGIVKMRERGLRNLRRILDPIESECKRTIDDWETEAYRMNLTIRVFERDAQKVKLDAYHKILAWLNSFDLISWEGDLSYKQMAEQAGKNKELRKQVYKETGQWPERTPDERQLEASQRYRQIAGLSMLREKVKQRYPDRLQNIRAAYSTRTCPECGGAVESGRKLLLVCENGHQRDQDVASALYFLNNIDDVTHINTHPLDIPSDMCKFLRVMTLAETRLDITRVAKL